jgi:hypothetical protein
MSVAQRTRGQEAVRSGYLPVSRRLLMAAPMAAFAAAAAHLAWEASHGGIKSHHLLNQTDLPAVSNSWGLLVLPVLGWLAAYFVGRRTTTSANALSRALAAFCGSLMVALALSAAFRLESSNLTAGLFFAVLLSGVALRTYRAEYVFGFVLGMTFVFGSVLPTMAALLAGAVSVLAHFVLYPVVAALYKRLCVATG